MLPSSSPEEDATIFALSDYGSPYIIVLLCLEKKNQTKEPLKPAVTGAGRLFAYYFLTLVVCNEGIAAKVASFSFFQVQRFIHTARGFQSCSFYLTTAFSRKWGVAI